MGILLVKCPLYSTDDCGKTCSSRRQSSRLQKRDSLESRCRGFGPYKFQRTLPQEPISLSYSESSNKELC